MYAQAAPHLYGIIMRILPNDVRSAAVLESLFMRIWAERMAPRYAGEDVLNTLRAEAHRAAIEAKLADQLVLRAAPLTTDADRNLRPDLPQKLSALSQDDLEFLSCAYLDAYPLDVLARRYNESPRALSARLSALIDRLLEASS